MVKKYSPNHALVNKSSTEVVLKILDIKTNKRESVNVQTISSEQALRYRDWVEANRDYVHRKTKNKVGYIHIPDMGPQGFAEFHRYFLTELDYDGLVIDVRFNGGGHVSPLILSKFKLFSKAFDNSFNSSFTYILRAWNVRVAGSILDLFL